MKNFLTEQEILDLRKQHKTERDKRTCDRIKAVLLKDKGYSYTKISEILLLDDETIRRHIQDYQNEKKLRALNGGSKSKLNESQTNNLIAHLEQKTYRHTKDICAYVKATYGITYEVSGMTKWLQAHNFRHKKPHAVPAKADKEKQAEFVAYYEKLKKKSKNKEPIYFADSSHPQHQTRLAYGWIKKGKRKEIATTARQRRVNIMGGISLEGHKIVYEQADRINSASINVFLTQLRKKNPGDHKIHLIVDNASYHKSKEVRDHAKELSIQLHFLPPYSPNLNPIERLWKLMHEDVTYNRYYEKFSDFTEAIMTFFKTIGRKKKILRSRITDNFQKIGALNFAS